LFHLPTLFETNRNENRLFWLFLKPAQKDRFWPLTRQRSRIKTKRHALFHVPALVIAPRNCTVKSHHHDEKPELLQDFSTSPNFRQLLLFCTTNRTPVIGADKPKTTDRPRLRQGIAVSFVILHHYHIPRQDRTRHAPVLNAPYGKNVITYQIIYRANICFLGVQF
jgi:hypothetical protein